MQDFDVHQKERIDEIFDSYDKSKNRRLDREEFTESLKELIEPLKDEIEVSIPALAEEALKIFDFNKNGTIEYEEFLELVFFLIDEKGLTLY